MLFRSPALIDLVAGRIQVMFENLAPLIPYVREGKLRALAVASSARVASIPDVPTVAEAGLPQFEIGLWNGIMAPAGTPRDTVLRLNAELRKALTDPGTQETLARYGMFSKPDTPEAFGSFIDAEIERWGKVVKASGAKVD